MSSPLSEYWGGHVPLIPSAIAAPEASKSLKTNDIDLHAQSTNKVHAKNNRNSCFILSIWPSAGTSLNEPPPTPNGRNAEIFPQFSDDLLVVNV